MNTQTKQAWTPAPWSYENILRILSIGPDPFADHRDDKANARLISKAPEMAELLRDCRDVIGLAESNMFRGCRCPNNGSGDCESCLTEQQLRQQLTEVSRLLVDLEAV